MGHTNFRFILILDKTNDLIFLKSPKTQNFFSRSRRGECSIEMIKYFCHDHLRSESSSNFF